MCPLLVTDTVPEYGVDNKSSKQSLPPEKYKQIYPSLVEIREIFLERGANQAYKRVQMHEFVHMICKSQRK